MKFEELIKEGAKKYIENECKERNIRKLPELQNSNEQVRRDDK